MVAADRDAARSGELSRWSGMLRRNQDMAANMSSPPRISESSAPNTFNSLKSFESKNELAFQALRLGLETWTIWHLVRNAIQRPADPVLPRLIILLNSGDF